MKKLILGLMIAGGLFGQRTDTIYQTLFKDKSTAGVSATVKNIGQSYHLMVGAITGPCPGFVGRIELQGSYDGVDYVRIGQPFNNLVAGSPSITWAYGAFPFVRANMIANTLGCAVTVSYSGSLSGSKVNAVYDSNVKNGFIPGTFDSAIGVIPIVSCGNYTKQMSVYGIYVNNTTAATITDIYFQIRDNVGTVLDSFSVGSLSALDHMSMKAETVPILGANQGVSAFTAHPPLTLEIVSSAVGLTGWALARCE